jgi:hypothetical protein
MLLPIERQQGRATPGKRIISAVLDACSAFNFSQKNISHPSDPSVRRSQLSTRLLGQHLSPKNTPARCIQKFVCSDRVPAPSAEWLLNR